MQGTAQAILKLLQADNDASNVTHSGKQIAASLMQPSTWSNGERATLAIMLPNLAVFALWRLHPNQAMMAKHFLSSVSHLRAGRYHVLLTSTFSHISALHLGVNMYALYNFGPLLIDGRAWQYFNPMNVAEYLGFYLGAGLAGSLATEALQAVRGVSQAGLGASGALFGVLTYMLMAFPHSKLSVMFIPATGDQAFWGLLGVNLGLCALSFARHVPVDGMAHLGGTVAGYAYYRWKHRHVRGAQGLWPRHMRGPIDAFTGR
jgi:membrane associated rhomboid family serine protease